MLGRGLQEVRKDRAEATDDRQGDLLGQVNSHKEMLQDQAARLAMVGPQVWPGRLM